jgi:hypothetical protein
MGIELGGSRLGFQFDEMFFVATKLKMTRGVLKDWSRVAWDMKIWLGLNFEC